MRVIALLLAMVIVAPGCFVQGEPDQTVISIQLGVGGVPKGRAVESDEVIDLAAQPCYVGVDVNAADMAEPVRAAWACDPGEALPLTEDNAPYADLELTVIAGEAREIRMVAFLNEDGWITSFAGYDTKDLAPGLVELELELSELEVGTLDGLITGAPSDVVQIRLTDLDSGVRLPRVEATPSGDGFHFEVPWLPRGRFFGLTLILVGDEELAVPDCPVYVTGGSVRVLDVDAANGTC